MYRCLLVALLVFCLSGATPLTGPPVAARETGVRDTEHDEPSATASNTELPRAELGPEVPDMLSGVTVNKTFLHKVDSDNDEPGTVVTPVPELSTHHNESSHETNLTDRVNSPRVLDPGTTHQEESANKSLSVLNIENATKEDMVNAHQTMKKPVPEIPLTLKNNTVQSSSSELGNKTNEKKVEELAEKPEDNSTKAVVENGTSPPSAVSGMEVKASPTSNQATGTHAKNETKPEPVKNELKPQLPPSGQVEVFAPSTLNETQNLLVGPEPHTSEQHADHLQLSNTSDPSFLEPSQSAAILAGVFVAVAFMGYMGLLVWRRLLEKRYGNREMLVNEDEFYDTSDLKHFEL